MVAAVLEVKQGADNLWKQGEVAGIKNPQTMDNSFPWTPSNLSSMTFHMSGVTRSNGLWHRGDFILI